MNKKNLLLFTNRFPYGERETTFINPELKKLSSFFRKIIILPYNTEGPLQDNLPENCMFENLKCTESENHFRPFIKNIFLFIYLFFADILKSKSIKNISYKKSHLLRLINIKVKLEAFIKSRNISLKDTVFYSYWFGDWATVISMLKSRDKTINFISRVHGYDLYSERNKENYISYRFYQLKYVDKLICISQNGLGYLGNKYPNYKNKYYLNYLGARDNGTNPFNKKDTFRLVSCSRLIPLKRVDLIIKILQNITFNIEWIHFGEGPLLNDIIKLSKQLPQNVQYTFKGWVTNDKILDYYKSTSVNLFINVSNNEGLPVSIMEAISFGIPAMATMVGGVDEIVNENTGITLPEDFDPYIVANQISTFRESDMNSVIFRKKVRDYWNNNFNIEKNIESFIDLILK